MWVRDVYTLPRVQMLHMSSLLMALTVSVAVLRSLSDAIRSSVDAHVALMALIFHTMPPACAHMKTRDTRRMMRGRGGADLRGAPWVRAAALAARPRLSSSLLVLTSAFATCMAATSVFKRSIMMSRALCVVFSCLVLQGIHM